MPNGFIPLSGDLLGHRLDPATGKVEAEIVWVRNENRPTGPAENAFVLVEPNGSGSRARYISWINYFDLEYAEHRQPGRWALVEPAQSFRQDVQWQPFGWSQQQVVPTIGDAILDNLTS
ncbi:MAG: hypothetical protein AAGD01_16285 [Acidobacteriota bacterium]